MKRKQVRALSSGDVMAYSHAAALSRKTADDRPVHQAMDSLFSVESGFTNFRGLINWGLIMLLVLGGKMALTNLISNGIIVDPFIWRYILKGEHAKPGGILFIASSNVFILFAYGIELFFYKFAVPNSVAVSIIGLNLVSVILFPSVVILSHDWSPFFSAPCIMLYIVIFLKLWSYAHVNWWCRTAARNRSLGTPLTVKDLLKTNHAVIKRHRENLASGYARRALSTVKEPVGIDTVESVAGDSNHEEAEPSESSDERGNEGVEEERRKEKDQEQEQEQEEQGEQEEESSEEMEELGVNKIYLRVTRYPDNLSLGDLYYFIFAPTLCYELNFPRTFTIRKRFLLKRLLELLCLCQVIVMLVQQWMIPGLKSSVTPFIRSRWIYTLERLLNIAIPNHIIWLLSFYALFHSYLNVLAELMKFADRTFYADWWNASSVTAFWSSWNIPVHRWCSRHIYKPMLISGFTRFTAACAVFFVSAFFHELMVSVPLKMPRMWAFLGMLGQQPYAQLVHHYCPKGGKLGNMAMWLTLIVGQPLALYMYFHDYYVLRIK